MNVPIPEIDCGCMPHIYVNLLVETAGFIASDIEDVPTPFVFDPCVVFKEVPGLVKKPREVLSIRVAAFSGAVPPSGLGAGVVIPVDLSVFIVTHGNRSKRTTGTWTFGF